MTLVFQLTVFALMLLLGMILGLWFDFYRFVNRRRTPLAPLLDFFFWAVITGTVLVVLMVVNHLELRLYLFISMGLGFFFYLRLLSSLVLKVFEKIFSLIIRCAAALMVVLSPLAIPLKLAGALTDSLAIVIINGVAWLTISLKFKNYQQENTPPM